MVSPLLICGEGRFFVDMVLEHATALAGYAELIMMMMSLLAMKTLPMSIAVVILIFCSQQSHNSLINRAARDNEVSGLM